MAQTVFDITQFGAVGDGKTDATPAIRRALALAAACRGSVTVPAGNFCTDTLTLAPGVTLMGQGGYSYHANGSSVLTLGNPDAQCLIDLTDGFGATLSGLSLDGKMLGNGVHGVQVRRAEYNGGGHEDCPVVQDCRIGHFSGDGVHLSHVWCFTVRRNMLCFNAGNGLFVDGWDGFIDDNWFSGNRKSGIGGGQWASALSVCRNRIEWNDCGICLPAGESLLLSDNFFDRNRTGLFCGGEDTVYYCISAGNNLFRRNGRPDADAPFSSQYLSCHMFFENCRNVNITGNNCRFGRDDGDSGVYSPDYGVVLRCCDGVVFSGNAMQECCLKTPFFDGGGNRAVQLGENISSLYIPESKAPQA